MNGTLLATGAGLASKKFLAVDEVSLCRSIAMGALCAYATTARMTTGTAIMTPIGKVTPAAAKPGITTAATGPTTIAIEVKVFMHRDYCSLRANFAAPSDLCAISSICRGERSGRIGVDTTRVP